MTVYPQPVCPSLFFHAHKPVSVLVYLLRRCPFTLTRSIGCTVTSISFLLDDFHFTLLVSLTFANPVGVRQTEQKLLFNLLRNTKDTAVALFSVNNLCAQVFFDVPKKSTYKNCKTIAFVDNKPYGKRHFFFSVINGAFGWFCNICMLVYISLSSWLYFLKESYFYFSPSSILQTLKHWVWWIFWYIFCIKIHNEHWQVALKQDHSLFYLKSTIFLNRFAFSFPLYLY